MVENNYCSIVIWIMRYMHYVKQRGSDVFKMPGIPRTNIEREKYHQRQEPLHQSKQVWPLERFSSQRSPWLAATIKVKQSLAGCFGVHQTPALIPQTHNLEVWNQSSRLNIMLQRTRNGCDFQRKSIQDFLMCSSLGSYLNWNSE